MRISEVERWSVDIGNVLFHNLLSPIPKFIEQQYQSKTDPQQLIESCVTLLTPIFRAQEGLKFLLDRVGADRLWLISKASPLQQKISRLALTQKFGLNSLGFKPEHLLFCAERNDKLSLIQEHNIQGHIDDRGEVIASIQDNIPYPIWFSPEPWDYEKWELKVYDSGMLVRGWSQLLSMLDL